eukprot:8306122-Karenia_brevis.AAC.1
MAMTHDDDAYDDDTDEGFRAIHPFPGDVKVRKFENFFIVLPTFHKQIKRTGGPLLRTEVPLEVQRLIQLFRACVRFSNGIPMCVACRTQAADASNPVQTCLVCLMPWHEVCNKTFKPHVRGKSSSIVDKCPKASEFQYPELAQAREENGFVCGVCEHWLQS